VRRNALLCSNVGRRMRRRRLRGRRRLCQSRGLRLCRVEGRRLLGSRWASLGWERQQDSWTTIATTTLTLKCVPCSSCPCHLGWPQLDYLILQSNLSNSQHRNYAPGLARSWEFRSCLLAPICFTSQATAERLACKDSGASHLSLFPYQTLS
jgi:hypothetical protein